MTAVSPQEIGSAHSPDSDDAFMFYGLATKKIRSTKVNFRHVLEDIESLNRNAMKGKYELTAISYHAYPYVADKYVLMASGSSIGDGYGPMLVSTRPMDLEDLKGKKIAIPFERDMDLRMAEKFVGMYVNHYTVDCGDVVPVAAQKLLDMGYEAGLVPSRVKVEFVR